MERAEAECDSTELEEEEEEEEWLGNRGRHREEGGLSTGEEGREHQRRENR